WNRWKPNTGKSSILNALLNYDKAIVSSVAGTTRDVVEGCIEIKGVKFNLSDTAGIRDSEDEIESIGVDLSKRILETSDLILFVMDGSDKDSTDDEIYSLVKDKNLLTVLNKTDKGEYFDERADLSVSALTKNNIDVLRETMYSKTVGQGIDLNGDFLTEERHYESIVKALERLQSAKSNMDDMPLDVIAIDIKDAWDALGEISGKTATEEIINNIFSKFCVGK
ncbi:MAG: GTP-binding protein, partial [Clostridiales bacterium]|nr:GTP-binding protein [Clostridiales bacterium]